MNQPSGLQETELATLLQRHFLAAGSNHLDGPAKQVLQNLQDTSASAQRALDAVCSLLPFALEYLYSPFDTSRPFPRQGLDALARAATVAALLPLVSHGQNLAAAALTLPPNWESLSAGDLDKALYIAKEELICTAWSPDPDTVRKLLDSSGPTHRNWILVDRRVAIAKHACAHLDAVPEALQDRATLARKAAEVLDAGFHEAAHSLAVNVISAILENDISKPSGGIAQHGQGAEADVIPARDLTRALVLAAAGPTYAGTTRRPPSTDRLSRHVTFHKAPTDQFSRPNAVRAVLLAGALVLDQGLGPHLGTN